jgi:hypothetical protein
MATLYITEYANMAIMPNTLGQAPQEVPITEQTVAIGASSAASANFQLGTRMVRLHSDVICSLIFGVSPTATTGNGRFAANQTEFRGVPEGGTLKVAVIANT